MTMRTMAWYYLTCALFADVFGKGLGTGVIE
jgi:hypothetical protein